MAGGLRWSEEQLAEWQQRARKPTSGLSGSLPLPGKEEADPGLERDLQDRVEDWCADNGYPFFHDRSRGKNVPGFPDLVIALRSGRTLWLELKSKSGRLSAEQKLFRLKLLALGHEWYEVRSYKRFLEVVNG